MRRLFPSLVICALSFSGRAAPQAPPLDPTTVLWYTHPADKWENAFPVGNGRLGAMVFGGWDEERIQINEETCWSGGPYSTTVKGARKHLAEIQQLIFTGKYREAHKVFGRALMGYPVEQQKYQSLANLILVFPGNAKPAGYHHQLDLSSGIVTTRYQQNGIHFRREVFVSPVDQVIVIRLTASKPGAVSFRAELRGCRNQAHSNYATDYFRMDGDPPDQLVLTGKSADYLGVKGRLRYEARLRALPEGGSVRVEGQYLQVTDADAVTLVIAAATNFVDFRDVSGDPHGRVAAVLKQLADKDFASLKSAQMEAHQRLFGRVAMDLVNGPNGGLPTDERIKNYDGTNDPDLAALCLQFGRYLLITSSRPGTQPANLQGIWNEDMNPSWDSKYTTNINTEMNYWPAEVANLSECAAPLFRMIKELTVQGSDVAREHYGARGWVFHQNTDLWRVAAPMDGPDWGAFTAGGAWLCTHLWEHYRYTGERNFLREYYPAMKGSVEFFLDFLTEHPRFGWLVTNPSTSPENFPGRPGNDPFYDEVCGWVSPGTTICAGSAIDMQILYDLFSYTLEAAAVLGKDDDLVKRLREAKDRLAPPLTGKAGDLQEWLEDWPQKEKSHRHISNLYGLFPGNRISVEETPDLARAAAMVLEQRGLPGNGWSSAWKTACWARLHEAERAADNFRYYIGNYATTSLFAICSRALQVDGALGMTAAIAEMLMQSHLGYIQLLPALPAAWPEGRISGLRARGGFEIGFSWKNGEIDSITLTSLLGKPCTIRSGKHKVTFNTDAGASYTLDGALAIVE